MSVKQTESSSGLELFGLLRQDLHCDLLIHDRKGILPLVHGARRLLARFKLALARRPALTGSRVRRPLYFLGDSIVIYQDAMHPYQRGFAGGVLLFLNRLMMVSFDLAVPLMHLCLRSTILVLE